MAAYLVSPTAYCQVINDALFNIKTSPLSVALMTDVLASPLATTVLRRKQQLALAANQLFCCGASWPSVALLSLFASENKAQRLAVKQLFTELGVRVYHSDRFTVSGGPQTFIIRIALAANSEADVSEVQHKS